MEGSHRVPKPDADFFRYGFEHLCRMRRDNLRMESLLSAVKQLVGLGTSNGASES